MSRGVRSKTHLLVKNFDELQELTRYEQLTEAFKCLLALHDVRAERMKVWLCFSAQSDVTCTFPNVERTEATLSWCLCKQGRISSDLVQYFRTRDPIGHKSLIVLIQNLPQTRLEGQSGRGENGDGAVLSSERNDISLAQHATRAFLNPRGKKRQALPQSSMLQK